MEKGFVVSAILYPLLVLTLALILGIISMSDNRRKILDNMKLEVSEESETDPEMSNSALYYKMKALEEAYAEMSSRLSEERLEELKSETLLKGFPVGSIFTSTSSTNPSSYIGGTWVAYGQGRTLVGVGSNGTSSYSVGATGGSETHTHKVEQTVLTEDQIPSHTHGIPSLTGTTASAGAHTHNFLYNNTNYSGWPYSGKVGGSINFFLGDSSGTKKTGIASAGAHTHTVTTQASTTQATGGTSGHTHSLTSSSNLSPYIVVYFWKRIS